MAGSYGARGNIGHVCPSIPLDMILNEVQQMMPDDVMMVYSSLYIEQLRQEDFDRAIAKLDEAVGHMVEGEADCVIVGGGPVVAAMGSDEQVVSRTREIAKLPSISTTGAMIAGLRHFDAKRIAVATPYVDMRNDLLKTYLEGQGFEVAAIGGLGIDRAADIAKMPFDRPYEHAKSVAAQAPDVDAMYIPCARFPVVRSIGAIESETGVPVVTSTLAMVWWGLRAIGVDDTIEGYGRLLSDQPGP